MGLEDLLYKDYQNDHKFTLATFSPPGAKTAAGITVLYSTGQVSLFHPLSLSFSVETHHNVNEKKDRVGKKARDLLYKDYQNDHRFTLTTFSPTGDVIFSFKVPGQRSRKTITSSGTKKGEFLAADVNTRLKNKNIAIDIKVDTSCNVT
ncbi:hypothetical protein SADUNF_Sadunf15G0041200 [Salix dunnii]|uniref:Uncharacterized protein n=1 Tax=Salix dunnii TaxID=1413687 RepID=A0A835JAH6_9ROSI|nr:hypothetical protein SADUNF_Sadunf15G0041200 [Salix dunnii]